MTIDGGVTWSATVSARAYGVKGCESVYGLGSWCYIDDNEQERCEDLITENECETKNNSTWNPLSTCVENCGLGEGGVCCSLGGDWGFWPDEAICNDDIGPDECSFFEGIHYTFYHYIEKITEDGNFTTAIMELRRDIDGNLTPMPIECAGLLPCNDFFPGSPNCIEGQGYLLGHQPPISNRLCVGSCDEVSIACCKDGSCVGDNIGTTEVGNISPTVCRYVYGGVPVIGQKCGDFDCCDYLDHTGACCRKDIEQCLDDIFYSECILHDDGVFMGPGTACEGDNAVNCCFPVMGSCCMDGSCNYVNHDECTSGTFYPGTDCGDLIDIEECFGPPKSILGWCCDEEDGGDETHLLSVDVLRGVPQGNVAHLPFTQPNDGNVSLPITTVLLPQGPFDVPPPDVPMPCLDNANFQCNLKRQGVGGGGAGSPYMDLMSTFMIGDLTDPWSVDVQISQFEPGGPFGPQFSIMGWVFTLKGSRRATPTLNGNN